MKSRVDVHTAREAIRVAADNGKIINRKIFNGVFAFESDNINYEHDPIEKILSYGKGIVDNVCLGKDIFIKYWVAGMPLQKPCEYNNYAVYQIEDLAFGYFISNLVEDIYISMHGDRIPASLGETFYPIDGTKEKYRLLTINLGDAGV